MRFKHNEKVNNLKIIYQRREKLLKSKQFKTLLVFEEKKMIWINRKYKANLENKK